MSYGLRRNDVKRIITQRLNSNPDIFYYIDVDYIDELVELITEGIADVIEENNRRLINDLSKGL